MSDEEKELQGQLIDKMQKLSWAFAEVNELVFSVYRTEEDEKAFDENYPFDKSFDEMAWDVGTWVEEYVDCLTIKGAN